MNPLPSRLTVDTALAAIPVEARFVTLFRHGSLEVEIYRPVGSDKQQPHRRDELYVIAAGQGTFFCDGERRPFVTGEALFVPAGMEHRFEDFSADFSAWVFFYGPDGGEATNQDRS
ncbi:cupin domain-containing protein [Arenimonas sp.]|uniref:cupin domain-containing protein n=1 Tax=Arenimonas sp. TaxID=1872635 RepID=UPI0039E65A21